MAQNQKRKAGLTPGNDLIAQAAEARAAARELHEAAQHAAAERKELRAVQAQIQADTAAEVAALLEVHRQAIQDHVTEIYATLNEFIRNAERKTQEHYTNVLGANGPVGFKCPGCGAEAAGILTQEGKAFCDTPECGILMWMPALTLAENLAAGHKITLNKAVSEANDHD